MRKSLPFFAVLLAPLLAGCPALDVLEGKESPHKAAQEQRVALTIAPAALVEPVVEPAPEPEAPPEVVEPPVIEVPPDPIVEVPPEPECVPVFRVVVCP